MCASNNINILEFILRTLHVPAAEKNTFLKDYIEELIEQPNQSERAVYEEIACNELVIEQLGEVEKAVDAHVEKYRSALKSTHGIKIGDYESIADFENEEQEHRKIADFYTRRRDEALAPIRQWPAYVGFGVGVLGLVGTFALGEFMLLLALGGAAFGGLTLLSNKNQVKKLHLNCTIMTQSADETLKSLYAEYRQYLAEFHEYDDYPERIKDEFRKL